MNVSEEDSEVTFGRVTEMQRVVTSEDDKEANQRFKVKVEQRKKKKNPF